MLIRLGFILCFCTCTWSLARKEDFCDAKLCRNGATHVACGKGDGIQATCPQETTEVVPMTSSLRNLILNIHNQRRSQVATGKLPGFPSASNMLQMSWDNTLAYVAGFNARGCIIEHDQCRSTHLYPYSGQNLGIEAQTVAGYFESAASIKRLIGMWFDEYRVCPIDVIDHYRSSTDGKVYGHFTQMIQDESDRVGCSMVRFTKDEWFSSYIACNYAWTNLLTEKVYAEGKECSGCPGKCSTMFPGLCKRTRPRYQSSRSQIGYANNRGGYFSDNVEGSEWMDALDYVDNDDSYLK